MRDRSSFRGSPSSRRSFILVGGILATVMLLFLLDLQGIMTPVRAYLTNLLTPALTAVNSLNQRINDSFAGSTDYQTLLQERDALRKENSDLKAQILRIPRIELENLRLREQLRVEQNNPWLLLGANISVQTSADGRRVAVIDVGQNQAVNVGMAVIARYQSSPPALIGVVSEVNAQSANVLLIDDYSSAISVQIYRGTDIVRGVLHGSMQSDAVLTMSEIERESTIAQGDVVVTAGLTRQYGPSLPNAFIPADVPIGVTRTAFDEGRSTNVEVQPYIDPELVRYVWIIKSDTK